MEELAHSTRHPKMLALPAGQPTPDGSERDPLLTVLRRIHEH
jgi:hypothetical protein